MGVPGVRSAAFRPCVVVRESAVHQGSTAYVLPDAMGIFKEFCLLGCVCGDLRGYVRHSTSVLVVPDDSVAGYCFKHYLYENLRELDLLPTKALNLFISKGSFAVLGFLAGLSLFVEDPRRRAELAMYVLPKGLESGWAAARGKGYVVGTGEFGEALVSNSCYLHPQCC